MAAKESRPKTVRNLIILLLVLGIGILYWFFFLKPASMKIGALRDEKNFICRDIEGLKIKLGRKSEIEQKWESLQEKEGYLLTRVPEEADLSEVLGAIEQLVGSFPVEIEALRAEGFQKEERHYFIPVVLKAKGEADVLLQLLKKLEQFAHMTLTEQVSLDRSGESYHMDVNFNLVFIPEG